MKRVAIVLTGLLLSTGAQAGNPHAVSCPCKFADVYDGSNATCVNSYTVVKGKESTNEFDWNGDLGEYFAGVIKSGNSYACVAEAAPTSPDPTEFYFEENMTRKQYVACVTELETTATLAVEEVGICKGM